MTKRARQARDRRKAVKRFFKRFFLICVLVPLGAAGLIMNYQNIQRFIERFTLVPVETLEIDSYYSLLSKHQTPGGNLVVDLDVGESEDLKVALDTLKARMGMGRDRIGLEPHPKITPPAYIHKEGEEMTIFVSERIRERREQINLLVHELGHIYVWRLDESVFGLLDQERLVDISGIFLGLGVLTLNGFTDDYRLLPEGGYATSQKKFGYLKPEQFGYLTARYAAERGIPDSEVLPHLNEAGRKYYKIGSAYLQRLRTGLQTPEPILRAQSAIRKVIQTVRQKITDAGILPVSFRIFST